MEKTNLRNVAIIAHVDHGKTTLVDGLLKQGKIFRANEAAMKESTILDSNALERERSITIFSKVASVNYSGVKINIIDTPGHSDFGGEVERVLNMADGALLVIDAQEGPMPQTRFVLKKALALGLKIIVIINKIDKKDARIADVLRLTENLFLDLAVTHEHLDYPVLYAVGREGKAWETLPKNIHDSSDLKPLFEAVLNFIPAPKVNLDGSFKLLVTTLDYDSFNGKYVIGRAARGLAKRGERLQIINGTGKREEFELQKIFSYHGLGRTEIEAAEAGEIVALTGSREGKIGDTVSSLADGEILERLEIEEPTLKISLGVNTSPLAGREGKSSTSRQLRERLLKELETNVSLRVEETPSGNEFLISGRGELHLSILIETLRREGYEFQVGRPEVITKTVDGVLCEPVVEAVVSVPKDYAGAVISELGARRGELLNQAEDGRGTVFLTFKMTTRATLGLRSLLLTLARGQSVLSTSLIGFEPLAPTLPKSRNGVLIAHEAGKAVTYGLNVAQGRGQTLIDPGTEVYEGMIVGVNNRNEDIEINVCKEKHQSNVRSSTADFAIQLSPKLSLSLEQSLNFLAADEFLEVTPKSLRLRKKLLAKLERTRAVRNSSRLS
ncbi:MAG: translational GTPase TypA [Patescibacteria group bacterium]|nr:translational GTPase TypA [Patescibacteria group bacterium]